MLQRIQQRNLNKIHAKLNAGKNLYKRKDCKIKFLVADETENYFIKEWEDEWSRGNNSFKRVSESSSNYFLMEAIRRQKNLLWRICYLGKADRICQYFINWWDVNPIETIEERLKILEGWLKNKRA